MGREQNLTLVTNESGAVVDLASLYDAQLSQNAIFVRGQIDWQEGWGQECILRVVKKVDGGWGLRDHAVIRNGEIDRGGAPLQTEVFPLKSPPVVTLGEEVGLD